VFFIAGNSETIALKDVQVNAPKRVNNRVEFGDGEWKKSFTEAEIVLLRRYFLSLRSEYKLKLGDRTLHLRHGPTMRWSRAKPEYLPEPSSMEPVVCGHIRAVGAASCEKDGTTDLFVFDATPRANKDDAPPPEPLTTPAVFVAAVSLREQLDVTMISVAPPRFTRKPWKPREEPAPNPPLR
jgi:hypothetical protein